MKICITVSVGHEVMRSHWAIQHFAFRIGSSIVAVNFVIGGLFCYYAWHAELVKKNGHLNFVFYFVARYLRTLPIVLVTLMIIYAFPTNLGSGPYFNTALRNITGNCINNGWAEILLVSNQINLGEICLPHGWYLAADFHLYVLSFAILGQLHRNPKRAFRLLAFGIAFGYFAQAAMIWYYQVRPIWSFHTTNF